MPEQERPEGPRSARPVLSKLRVAFVEPTSSIRACRRERSGSEAGRRYIAGDAREGKEAKAFTAV